MINVKDIPVDIEEIRLWANGYRDLHGLSWQRLATESGVPAGTLQPFCKGTYQGDNERIAREMFKFMQSVENRTQREQSIPVNPGFFETDTAMRIRTCLQIAHMGRITVVATGPGTGKTMVVNDYAERAQPVWRATMKPSTATVNSMVVAILKAFGIEIRGTQWTYSGSNTIVERMRGRTGLLVVDEANHLTVDSFEELRSWHDETGVGICLLGNEELLRRIESGRMRDRFARLNSRIAMRHVQRLPLVEDVEAFCNAWGLSDPGIRKYLEKIALTPDAGGLRECRQLVEHGAMIAASEERGLTLSDLRDAQRTRATRWIDA